MFLKKFFQKFLSGTPSPPFPETEFPKNGILWHEWNDETEKLIAERNRPVLLFVANTDGTVWPFLRGVLQAMPLNRKLRELLKDYYIGVFMNGKAIPELFRDLGAGSRYNIAILSPAGLTPMAVIDPTDGKPKEIVATIRKVLEKLQDIY